MHNSATASVLKPVKDQKAVCGSAGVQFIKKQKSKR